MATNKDVLQLFEESRKVKKCNVALHKKVCQLFPSLQSVSCKNIVTRLQSLKTYKQKLSKNKRKEELDEFLQAEFDHSATVKMYKSNKGAESDFFGGQPKPENEQQPKPKPTKRRFSFSDTVNQNLADELSEQQELNQSLSKKLKTETENTGRIKMKLKQFSPRKVTQDRKRKKARIEKLKKQIFTLRKQRIRKAEKTKEKKIIKKLPKGTQCNMTCSKTLTKAELDRKEEYIRNLENQIEELKEKLETQHHAFIETRTSDRGRPYTTEVRDVYYRFLAADVAADKIAPLIKDTLNILSNTEIDELPSSSAALDMIGEAGELSRQQLASVLSASENTTMYRDGTSKKGKHYAGLQIATEEKVYTVGMRQMSTGTAKNYFESGKSMLCDIEDAAGNENVSDKILSNVSCVMTDRHVVETKQNTLWEEEKKKTGTDKDLMHFHCAMHPLLQFAEVSERCLKKFEETTKTKKGFLYRGESGTSNTIRQTAKLFFKDGVGDPLLSIAFLEKCGIKELPVVDHRHGRFNVLFHNGGGVYFIKDHVIAYLETKEKLNGLQQSLLQDLKNTTFMAGCRALGLVGKAITSPYMRLVETPGRLALDMNVHYQRLIEKLEEWSEDATSILTGQVVLYPGYSGKSQDRVHDALTTDQEDSEVKLLVQSMCTAIMEKAKHLFKDHLPGGKYAEPSDAQKNASKSCASHNITLERLMAQQDKHMAKVTHCNQPTREAKLLYKGNTTSKWCDSLQDKELDKRIKQARRSFAHRRKKIFKVRKEELKKQVNELLETRAQKKVQSEQRAAQERERLLLSLQDLGGLWINKEQVNGGLTNLSSKAKKMQALKKQISARQKLIKQSVEQENRSLFAFSKGKKPFTIKQLQENLERLINLADSTGISRVPAGDLREKITLEPEILIGKLIEHRWSDGDGNDTWWQGKVLSLEKCSYTIIYWQKDTDALDDADEADGYEVTVTELLEDLGEGNLDILNL